MSYGDGEDLREVGEGKKTKYIIRKSSLEDYKERETTYPKICTKMDIVTFLFIAKLKRKGKKKERMNST